MYIALLGRQPEISIAELEAVFLAQNVKRISDEFASIKAESVDIDILGGTIKIAKVIHSQKSNQNNKMALLEASKLITQNYLKKWQSTEGKITLGISAYGLDAEPRDVQKIGIILKSNLKKHGVNLRLIPNKAPALSTATSHNNKLGSSEKKVELVIVKTKNSELIIAESCGIQNITAYTTRDRKRPRRDAFVGMLPPKLAQIMLNLAIQNTTSASATILDPFCGTGTVLQEVLLRGFAAHGSDLNPKMVSYSQENLAWLTQSHRLNNAVFSVEQADAMTNSWKNSKNISVVVCETYLGQPFSAPPSTEKLKEVVRNCDHIVSEFLKNIHPQLKSKTPLCIAVPAWINNDGRFTHLPLIKKLESLGYSRSNQQDLLYHRPDQVVAREILVLSVK